MKLFSISIIILTIFSCSKKELTAKELLNNTIAYHDPNNNWSTFNGEFTVTMETPDSPKRISNIAVKLIDESFSSETKRDSTTINYIIEKGKCIVTKVDSLRIASLAEKPKRSHCETTNLYKNYYTYLYGLPMKLKDKGTIISDTIERKTFKGKDYLVLKATYKESVGKDIWYYYFNPKTYAMEVYQFFKTGESGKLKPESGEYILLTEEEIVNKIKMPKNRAWYYNKDDKYLGTDILN